MSQPSTKNKISKKNALKRVVYLLILIFLVLLFGMSIKEDTSVKKIRSTSLQKMITNGDNYERIDYVDENGTIIYAADKHYATKIKIREDNQVLEKYYDADGEPIRQNLGFYSVLRVYNQDGQEYKTIYQDLDGNPMINRAGYAVIERTFNTEGTIDTELYYDENESPIETNLLGYGCNYMYDDNGKVTTIIYLGLDGQPIQSGQGFAIVHKTYYEEGEYEGLVNNEYYYDEEEKPIKLGMGQYGLHREYDKEGRTNLFTYLGIDGMPTTTVDGYTTIKRTYYNDDSVKCDMYYDINNKPIALSKGQYGVLKQEGRSIWLDKSGNEKQSFHNLVFGSKWFSLFACFIIVVFSLLANKKLVYITLVLYTLIIIHLAFVKRTESAWGMNLIPLWSYTQIMTNKELAIEILNNILFFIPFTTLLYRITNRKTVVLAALLFSLFIELVQYFLHLGLCETDDIISNTFGGYVGYLLARNYIYFKQRIRKTKEGML